MARSAELPFFDWTIDRRDFLRSTARLAGGTAGTIYLAPLIAGCEVNTDLASLELMAESMGINLVRWGAEEEGKDTIYFFAQDQGDTFIASLTDGNLLIDAFYDNEGKVRVFEGPVCDVLKQEWTRDFFGESDAGFGKALCDKLFPLFHDAVIDAVSEIAPKISEVTFKTIRDGNLIVGPNQSILKRGRRYSVIAETSETLSAVKVENVPNLVARQIPESENKLNFGAGDILIDSRGKGWYLRNDGRYEIRERIPDFVQKRRKNMRVYEVPSWVINNVREHELPPATFVDWHGRTIDARSPVLIVLFSGLASSSDWVTREWEEVVKGLLEVGWKDSQIVYGTYNVGVSKTIGGKSVFKPEPYTQEHSTRFPGQSRDAASHLLSWLAEKCPLSCFAAWGHSEGGDLVFNAAVSHTDSVCQVGTIDAPLKGVDRALVSAGPFEFEELAYFNGCESWPIDDKCEAIRFYTAQGESSDHAQQVENQARWLREHGVGVFNASNKRDPLIGPEQAILENSDRKVGSYALKNLWDVPVSTSGPLGPHGVLLKHKPFIKEFIVPVIGRPA